MRQEMFFLIFCRFLTTSLVQMYTLVIILSAAVQANALLGGYGPLYPTKDKATGLELLALPANFTYTSYGTSIAPCQTVLYVQLHSI